MHICIMLLGLFIRVHNRKYSLHAGDLRVAGETPCVNESCHRLSSWVSRTAKKPRTVLLTHLIDFMGWVTLQNAVAWPGLPDGAHTRSTAQDSTVDLHRRAPT